MTAEVGKGETNAPGPSLIDYSVTQKNRLSPTLLLMAHLEAKF